MTFMNEWEVTESVVRFTSDPVLGPATRFLQAFVAETNQHSDGWSIWPLPARAARQLLQLIAGATQARFRADRSYVPPTQADVFKALRPIKSFMTRRGTAAGMTLPDIMTLMAPKP